MDAYIGQADKEGICTELHVKMKYLSWIFRFFLLQTLMHEDSMVGNEDVL